MKIKPNMKKRNYVGDETKVEDELEGNLDIIQELNKEMEEQINLILKNGLE